MKKKSASYLLTLFVFVVFQTSSSAQQYSEEMFWTTSKLNEDSLAPGHNYKGMVQARGNYLFNSTAVTNGFFNKLSYQKTFIQEEDKEQVIARLKSQNKLGVDINGSIFGTIRSKKDSTLQWEVGLGYRDFTYLNFTKDVFKLVFQGNSQFAGQDAKVGPSMLKQWSYGSFFVGAQKILSEKLVVGARLSLIKGGAYRETKMEDGALYTDPNGAYVDLTAPFVWYSQKRPDNPLTQNNGWGGGVDLYAQRWFKKSLLSFEVRDLGFVTWKNIDAYVGDKTYRYEGANISDILAPGNSFISSVELDSIAKELGIEKKVINKTTMLPTKLQLTYLYKATTKLSLKADLNYMFLKGYMPSLRASAYYAIIPNVYIVPAVLVGGYGKINTQLGLSATVAKHWSVQANVFALEYLIAPTKYSGHGAEVYLTKTF
jgi:hypothetical protein